jgi:hypothetical protein
MHAHDYIMGSRPELSDRLIEAGRGGSFGGGGVWGAVARRTEDLAFGHVIWAYAREWRELAHKSAECSGGQQPCPSRPS